MDETSPMPTQVSNVPQADLEFAARVLESIARQECPHCRLGDYSGRGLKESNAEFIAHAPEDIAYLLGEVARLSQGES